MPNVVDVSQLSPNSVYVHESEDERHARLEQTRREHELRIEKERVTFYVGGGLYVASLVASFWLAVVTSDEVQKWAMSLATLLGGGLAGFITGKQSK